MQAGLAMARVVRRSFAALGLAALLALAGGPAAAAEDAAGGERLQALIAILEDEAARGALVEELRALAAATRQEDARPGGGEDASGLEAGLRAGLDGLGRRVRVVADQFGAGGRIADWLAAQAGGERRGLWLAAAWQTALALGLAALGALAAARAVRPPLLRLRERRSAGWFGRLPIALARFGCGLVPVAAFAAIAGTAALAEGFGESARAICIAAATAAALVHGGAAALRAVLAPLAPHARLLPVGDGQAAYLTVWAARFLGVAVYGGFAVELLVALGLPAVGAALLRLPLALALAAMALVVIAQSRQTVAVWIRAHPGGGRGLALRRRLADIWHVPAMLAVAALFAAWALGLNFAFLLRGFAATALALLVALLISTAVHRGLGRLFRIGGELASRFPGLEKRTDRYLWAVGWLLNAAVWLLALVAVLAGWGIDAAAVLLAPAALDAAGRLLEVLAVAAAAALAWELGDGAITGYLARGGERAPGPRLKTLLPLARNALLIAIAAVATLTVLATLGLDIAPLLAGVGVAGIAIGFGAQALVRDVIAGAFILFEDQLSIGDWVEAGGKMGGVESISIRAVTLRDLDGYLHTVPFGQIGTLTNMMRDFGYAVIDVGIAYQEDTDRVIEALREVDREARRDAALAGQLAGELEVMGVTALGDSSVTLRVRVPTLPGCQWGVRRDYLRLVKRHFDEKGIEIPFPHLTVYFGELREGRTPPAIVRLDAGAD